MEQHPPPPQPLVAFYDKWVPWDNIRDRCPTARILGIALGVDAGRSMRPREGKKTSRKLI